MDQLQVTAGDLKYCAKGNHFLSPSEFTKNKGNKDGLQDRCRHCAAAFARDQKEKLHTTLGGVSYYDAFPDEVRRCTTCDEAQSIRDFYLKRNGLPRRQCRKCHAKAVDRAVKRNPEKRKAAVAAYIARMGGQRVINLRSRYGLTIEEYNVRLAAQHGKCAVCGSRKVGGRWGRFLIVDHCHQSGLVRGLLCARCNKLLGVAGDNLRGAQEAAKLYKSCVRYLKRFESTLATIHRAVDCRIK